MAKVRITEKDPNRFQKARKESGLTQAEVAEKLNTDRNTFALWERRGNMPADRLKTLAELYKKPTDYLLGLSEYKSAENRAIGEATGLSNASIETLRKWKEGSRTHEKLKMSLDGLAVIRLKMLDFLLENENIGLLDTLHSCIFGKFMADNKCIKLDSGTTVLGATNRTLQNAFVPAVAVCIEDLRDIAERGQTKTAQRLIKKRHDALARKDSR